MNKKRLIAGSIAAIAVITGIISALAATRQENEDGSYDSGGTVLGVREYSQEKFDARDLEALKNPVSQGVESGEPLTPEEAVELYAEYEAFGISYDKNTDELTYKGKTVRYFLDVKSSNGKPMNGGGFEGSMISMVNDENGVIDLYTVRDFDITNAEGEGKLIGIEPYNQKEFNRYTEERKKEHDGTGGSLWSDR